MSSRDRINGMVKGVGSISLQSFRVGYLIFFVFFFVIAAAPLIDDEESKEGGAASCRAAFLQQSIQVPDTTTSTTATAIATATAFREQDRVREESGWTVLGA